MAAAVNPEEAVIIEALAREKDGKEYILDFENGIKIKVADVIDDGGAAIAAGTLPLSNILCHDGDPYASVERLTNDHKVWNYLDAVKDGTNVPQMIALKIYENANRPFAELHTRENQVLERKQGNLLRTTWLKTKKNSRLNIIKAQYIFWEAGLGYGSFIEKVNDAAEMKHDTKGGIPDDNSEIVTFGSYIDPLSKPGKIWPDKDKKVRITEKFMEAFGFGKSSLWATTKEDNLTKGNSGKAFQYNMTIKIGEGCGGGCELNHTPPGANNKDPNAIYFKGNNEKNALVNGIGAAGPKTSTKTRLIVAKGWGDKVQVMLYYMFYYLKGKTAIMITCDMVVFCFCMIIGIPCVYTGVFERDTSIAQNLRNGVPDEGESFFSMLHFNPGTPLDNAKTNYKYMRDRIHNENKEFIDKIKSLIINFRTGIDVGDTYPRIFNSEFYNILATDMDNINAELLGTQHRAEIANLDLSIQQIIEDADTIKRKYLIVPMFKFVSGKIKFLQTKHYTMDPTIMTNRTIITRVKGKKMTDSFCQYAKDQFSNGGKLIGGVNRTKAEWREVEAVMAGRAHALAEQYRKQKMARDLRPAARAATIAAAARDARDAHAQAFLKYRNNPERMLSIEEMRQFPERDSDPKKYRLAAGDDHIIKDDGYTDDKKYVGKDADTFLFDDPTDPYIDGQGYIDPKNRGVDIQELFDESIYDAIDKLQGKDSGKLVVYNNAQGGRRNATRRRQKGGGGVDEILFETLYTLYVYRAQYDIELDRSADSINLDVLRELYEDYPKSEIQPNRNNTLRRVKGGPTTGKPATGTTGLNYYVQGKPSVNMSKLVTGMTLENMRKQPIHAQTRKRVRNNSGFGQPISGGRITRRKKRYHRRTRK